jgi:hypothetical protein
MQRLALVGYLSLIVSGACQGPRKHAYGPVENDGGTAGPQMWTPASVAHQVPECRTTGPMPAGPDGAPGRARP